MEPLSPLLLILLVVAGVAFDLGRRLHPRAEAPPRRREDESALYFKGVNYLLTDEPDKAIEAFTQAVRLNSETVEIYLSLGNLFRARGEVGRAIRIHQNIIARPSLDPEQRTAALYALAEDYRQGGFVDRAVEAYRQVLNVDENHKKALAGLQALHESEGRWEDAHNALKRLERVTGKNDPRREAHLYLQLGREEQRQGNKEAALSHFRLAIKVFPGCVEAWRLLGQAELENGEVKAAIKSFGASKKTRPSHFFLLVDALQRAYDLIGDERGFEKCMREAAQARSAPSRLLIRWAQWLSASGRHDEAVRVLTEGLVKYPGSAEVASMLVALLARAGQWPEAVEAARRCLDHLNAQQHNFQCAQCGFTSRDIYWKCPQCHHWDTMEPL